MRVLVALLAALLVSGAAAFVGTGEEHLSEAREFMRYLDGGANLDHQEVAVWRGRVESFSPVFADPDYPFAVCYPEGIQSGQLAGQAAWYLIDNPILHPQDLQVIVWIAHQDAYGLQDEDDCWMNIKE